MVYKCFVKKNTIFNFPCCSIEKPSNFLEYALSFMVTN